jgi:hypothetical protein
MVAHTRPWMKIRDKPDDDLPNITEQIQRQIEAEQKDIKKQLKHAQQQLDLTNVYPGRRGDTRST